MNATSYGGSDDGERTRRIPRWVKLTLIVLAVVALLVATMLIAGGLGGHGPQRHLGWAAAGGSR
jgi:hypothetical protein